MKRILFLAIVITSVLGCTTKNYKTAHSSAESKTKAEVTIDKIPIPDDLVKLITDNLEVYTIPTKEDYDPKLISFIKTIPYPYFCKNDFDGNGEVDYAFLLKSKDKSLTFFIFNCIKTNYHTINMGSIPMGITENGLATIISVKEKGDWVAFDTTISVPNGGISLELLEESRTHSYYWDGLKYQRFFAD